MSIWTYIPDAEYREQRATVDGKEITVYSDDAGENWFCYVDGDSGNYVDLEAKTEHQARAEALRVAREMGEES